MPRYFPPNLGAPRDIPDDGVIHHSVDAMIKAGILDEKSVPERGGNNPHLPSIASVTAQWNLIHKAAERVRLKRSRQGSEETLVNGGGSESDNGGADGKADGAAVDGRGEAMM